MDSKGYTYCLNDGYYYSTDQFDTTPPITNHEPYCFSALFKVVPKTLNFKFYSQTESGTSYLNWLRKINSPFVFSIDDFFYIKGRGVVVTGRVISGEATLNQAIDLLIPGCGIRKQATIIGIERALVGSAADKQTNPIGLLLRGPKSIEEIQESGLAVEAGLKAPVYVPIIEHYRKEINERI